MSKNELLIVAILGQRQQHIYPYGATASIGGTKKMTFRQIVFLLVRCIAPVGAAVAHRQGELFFAGGTPMEPWTE
jgi:hypothetical protein